MVSEKEWLQQTAEKFLQQEEEKVEKYYPHNLFVFIKAAVSVAFCSSWSKAAGRKGGWLNFNEIYRIFKKEFSVSPCVSQGQIYRQPSFGIVYGEKRHTQQQ